MTRPWDARIRFLERGTLEVEDVRREIGEERFDRLLPLARQMLAVLGPDRVDEVVAELGNRNAARGAVLSAEFAGGPLGDLPYLGASDTERMWIGRAQVERMRRDPAFKDRAVGVLADEAARDEWNRAHEDAFPGRLPDAELGPRVDLGRKA